ncbi:DNA-binding transcriptional MerR regulator [Metabacillus crassostreae]|uniref:helix-turn-helix domain-containing protein n=1 Tax=Metabacillus crassostreae TaxID=929098 RepID=UPI00195C518E|nr:helix-turn-helix domain-containing protein [Metabacillus crassostreae]MBM7604621.1 DNA-binding transcriptional MerR regulator [Metabacillus crassostreae]
MAAKYVTISKAASLVGEKVFILKNWEEEFSEFIDIKRDDKNARLLTPENIEMLRKIKSFKDSNMDTQTIKQLLSNQQTVADEANPSVSSDVVEEMKESLTKITNFIDSKEVQEILQLNEKLNQLEKNVVHSVNHKITETAKLQTEVARFEFSDVQDMISSLEETSHLERELYKEEIQTERDLAQKHTDAREERFLAFVKEHQVRQERIKHEQRFGLGFIKQIMGFAK